MVGLPGIETLKKKKSMLYIFRSAKMISVVRGAEIQTTRSGSQIKYMYRPRNFIESFVNPVREALNIPVELMSDPIPIYSHGVMSNQMAVIVNMDLMGNPYSMNLPARVLEENRSLHTENVTLKREVATIKAALADLEGKDRLKERMLKDAQHTGRIRQSIMTPGEQGFIGAGMGGRWDLGMDRGPPM